MRAMARGLVLILFTANWVASAEQSAPSFDFTRINENLRQTLSEVTREYRGVSEFNYAFDPARTDIAADRYGINLSAVLTEVPWTGNPVRVAATMDLQMKTGREKGMELRFSKDVTTEPLALVHYLVREWTFCPVPETFQGVLRVLEEQDCESRDEILAAGTLEELSQVLRTHLANSRVAVEGYVASLEEDLAGVRGGTLRTLVEKQLSDARSVLQGLRSVRLVDSKEGGLTLTADEFRFGRLVALRGLRVDITSTGMSVAATVDTSLGSLLYRASRPEVIRWLGAIERGEAYGTELVKLDARIWLNLIREIFAQSREN